MQLRHMALVYATSLIRSAALATPHARRSPSWWVRVTARYCNFAAHGLRGGRVTNIFASGRIQITRTNNGVQEAVKVCEIEDSEHLDQDPWIRKQTDPGPRLQTLTAFCTLLFVLVICTRPLSLSAFAHDAATNAGADHTLCIAP